LSVPFLLGVGGNVLVFVVFGVAFGVAAVAALGLPEMRSQALG
ncbi:MFS transporter, partial [Dermatophilus congolensis]|nr:MFS transporter [Dermatophilus congolensis]